MIVTKAHQIKKLENDILKLKEEIRISNIIIFDQAEVIDTLEKKVKHQCREINILLKRIRKNAN